MNRVKLSILTLATALPLASAVLVSAAGPNLVQNGDFDVNTKGWAYLSGKPTFHKETLRLTNDYDGNGSSYYGTTQCVKNVDDKAKYTIEADAWVPKTNPAFGAAGIYLNFHTGPNCDGAPLGGGHNSGGYTPDQRGKWLDLKRSVEAPTGAHSVSVRPAAIKEPQAPAVKSTGLLTVYFDNIKLSEQKAIKLPEVKPDNDLPIANPEVTPDPDPQPEEDLPVANPEVPGVDPQPEDEQPAIEPDAPQDEPPADDADEPTSDDSEVPVAPGSGSGGGQQQSKGGETTTARTSPPLPPQTGQTSPAGNDSNTILYGAMATCLAGLGLIVAVLFRRSRHAA